MNDTKVLFRHGCMHELTNNAQTKSLLVCDCSKYHMVACITVEWWFNFQVCGLPLPSLVSALTRQYQQVFLLHMCLILYQHCCFSFVQFDRVARSCKKCRKKQAQQPKYATSICLHQHQRIIRQNIGFSCGCNPKVLCGKTLTLWSLPGFSIVLNTPPILHNPS